MASVINDPNGRKRIEFTGADGRRKRVRIGVANAAKADAFRAKVEELANARAGGYEPSREAVAWFAALPPLLRKRVSAAGLMPPSADPARRELSLGGLLTEFLAAAEVKAGTRKVYEQARDKLVEFFGAGKLIRDLTPLDAEKWKQWLKAAGFAEATVAKRVKVARQAFKAAVRWRLLAESPFAGVRPGSQRNKARQFFLSRADAATVIAGCGDTDLATAFALARFGGLRVPSEAVALKWSDVDEAGGRFRVTSPKTERHPGGEQRWVPLFPELLPHLAAARRRADAVGSPFVLTEKRSATQNLGTRLERVLARVGVKRYPKLFQNLRSTRQTELVADGWPQHVVCAWLGNSEQVARDHYFQVTDADYLAAAGRSVPVAPKVAPNQAATPANPGGSGACSDPSWPTEPTGERRHTAGKPSATSQKEGSEGTTGIRLPSPAGVSRAQIRAQSEDRFARRQQLLARVMGRVLRRNGGGR